MTRTFSCTGQFFASFPLCLDISLLGILCVYCYYGFHLWNSLLQPSGRYLGAFCSKQCRAKQMACDVFRDFSRQKANVKKGRTSKDEGLDRISSSPSSSSSSSWLFYDSQISNPWYIPQKRPVDDIRKQEQHQPEISIIIDHQKYSYHFSFVQALEILNPPLGSVYKRIQDRWWIVSTG